MTVRVAPPDGAQLAVAIEVARNECMKPSAEMRAAELRETAAPRQGGRRFVAALLAFTTIAVCGCSGSDSGAPQEPPVGDPAWLAKAEESFHLAGGRITEQTETSGYF